MVVLIYVLAYFTIFLHSAFSLHTLLLYTIIWIFLRFSSTFLIHLLPGLWRDVFLEFILNFYWRAFILEFLCCSVLIVCQNQDIFLRLIKQLCELDYNFLFFIYSLFESSLFLTLWLTSAFPSVAQLLDKETHCAITLCPRSSNYVTYQSRNLTSFCLRWWWCSYYK